MGNTKSIGVAYSDQDLTGSTLTDVTIVNPQINISASATTPLTGSELIPVVQGGVTEKVTVADLFGSLRYGMFQHNQTISSGGATTANLFPLDTTDFANGVSVVDGSKITMAAGGVYNIQFSAQLYRSGGGAGFSTAEIWLSKNGTNLAETNGQMNVPQSGNKSMAAWNYLVQANAGDYFQLYWSSTDTGLQILYAAEGTDPTRPVTPAIIVTVTQVG